MKTLAPIPSKQATEVLEIFAKGISVSFFERFLIEQLKLFPNPTDVCFVFDKDTKKLIKIEWLSQETDHLLGWFFLSEVDCLNQVQREWLEQYLSDLLFPGKFCFLCGFELVKEDNTEPFILTRRVRSKQ